MGLRAAHLSRNLTDFLRKLNFAANGQNIFRLRRMVSAANLPERRYFLLCSFALTPSRRDGPLLQL
jgi:hypothetical protein